MTQPFDGHRQFHYIIGLTKKAPGILPFLLEFVYSYYSAKLGYYVEDKQSLQFDVDLQYIEPYVQNGASPTND